MTLILLGCSDAAPEAARTEPEPEQASSTNEQGNAAKVLPQTAVPKSLGLFVAVGDGLEAIAAGELGSLEVSNAERGFGFETPSGPVLSEARPTFVLWSSQLRRSTLRLTRFEPEVVLPEKWWEPAQRGYYGWLPHSNVRLVLEPVPGQEQILRLQPASALVPGLYVLHDGALLRGRERDEVSVFYPMRFERPERDQAFADFGAADSCLREIEQLFVDAHSLEPSTQFARFDMQSFSTNHTPRLRHCAARVQAVMLGSTDESLRLRCQHTLMSLHVFAHGLSWDQIGEILASLEHGNPLAALLYEWVELQALEQAVEGRLAIVRGEPQQAAVHARRLSALYQDRLAQGLAERRLESLERLLWIPLFIDPEWSATRTVIERLVATIEVFEPTFLAIAAHRLHRLSRLSSLFPDAPSLGVVEALLRGQAPELLAMAEGIELERAGERNVFLGPVLWDVGPAGDAKLEEALATWIRGRRKALSKCFEEHGRRKAGVVQQGMVLVRLRLSAGFFGQSTKLEVELPSVFDTAPLFGDQALLSCIEEQALTGASSVNVGTEASFVVAVGFNGDRRDAAMLR